MEKLKKFVTSIGVVALFLGFALMPAKIARVESAGAQGPKKQEDDQEPRRMRSRIFVAGNYPSFETRKPRTWKDDPLSRMRAEFESRGRITAPAIQRQVPKPNVSATTILDVLQKIAKNRMFPMEISCPTSDDFIQNAERSTKLTAVVFATILPHPTDPDTVYVLSAGGGLWKTTNFRSPNHKWRPLTTQ